MSFCNFSAIVKNKLGFVNSHTDFLNLKLQIHSKQLFKRIFSCKIKKYNDKYVYVYKSKQFLIQFRSPVNIIKNELFTNKIARFLMTKVVRMR